MHSRQPSTPKTFSFSCSSQCASTALRRTCHSIELPLESDHAAASAAWCWEDRQGALHRCWTVPAI